MKKQQLTLEKWDLASGCRHLPELSALLRAGKAVIEVCNADEGFLLLRAQRTDGKPFSPLQLAELSDPAVEDIFEALTKLSDPNRPVNPCIVLGNYTDSLAPMPAPTTDDDQFSFEVITNTTLLAENFPEDSDDNHRKVELLRKALAQQGHPSVDLQWCESDGELRLQHESSLAIIGVTRRTLVLMSPNRQELVRARHLVETSLSLAPLPRDLNRALWPGRAELVCLNDLICPEDDCDDPDTQPVDLAQPPPSDVADAMRTKRMIEVYQATAASVHASFISAWSSATVLVLNGARGLTPAVINQLLASPNLRILALLHVPNVAALLADPAIDVDVWLSRVVWLFRHQLASTWVDGVSTALSQSSRNNGAAAPSPWAIRRNAELHRRFFAISSSTLRS